MSTSRFSLGVLDLLLAFSVRLAAAEGTSAPFPWSWNYTPPPTCTLSQLWSRPIDLDGDQVPELRYERLDTQQRRNKGLAEDSLRFAVTYQYDDHDTSNSRAVACQYDDREAYFSSTFAKENNDLDASEAHVDILFPRMWRFADPQPTLVRVSEGLPIDTEPPTAYRLRDGLENQIARDFPASPPDRLYVHDLGWLNRVWGHHNLSGCTYDPQLDYLGAEYTGYLSLANSAPNEALSGIRSRLPDGWHLGWMRLTYLHEGPYASRPSPPAYVIQLDPDTAFLAGQLPQPRLYARVEGAEAVLHWSAAWAGYTLQSSPSLTARDWQPVAGVTNYTVRLPKSASAAFFRLSR